MLSVVAQGVIALIVVNGFRDTEDVFLVVIVQVSYLSPALVCHVGDDVNQIWPTKNVLLWKWSESFM